MLARWGGGPEIVSSLALKFLKSPWLLFWHQRITLAMAFFYAPQSPRPAGITLLSFFCVLGTLASGLAAVMLIMPGSSLDVLWRLNPHAHEGFVEMGRWSVFVMSTVCLACASAAWGLWRRRIWGYWTAVTILTVNLVGDAINAFLLRDWRTLIGLPIAGLMIAYLLRKRSIFDH